MTLLEEGIVMGADFEGNPVYQIQGHKATLPEFNVAIALYRLGFDFIYQAQFNGGRGSPGGIEVDFLVDTVPYPTPVWVHGEFWHMSGDQRNRDRLQMIRFDQLTDGLYAPGIELFEDSLTPRVEDALRTIREELL